MWPVKKNTVGRDAFQMWDNRSTPDDRKKLKFGTKLVMNTTLLMKSTAQLV